MLKKEDAEIVIGTLAESREEVANHVQHGNDRVDT